MRNSKTILAVVLCASLRAHAGFTENPELPPMFKQLDVARPDGSSVTVFVGNFDGSFATRKPLLIYLEGSGAMSQFIRAGDMTGYGIYGLVANSVVERRREVGIRMALGSSVGRTVRLFVGQGLAPALVGVVIGVGLAFGATRLIRHLLWGVDAADPLTFAGAAVLFVVMAVVASAVPTTRIARIAPSESLRDD